MNKKGTKKLSGALAATTVLTSVAGATPAFAKGTDWDAIYKTAYEAMQKAQADKTQESINAARKAIGDLAKNKQLFTMAATFSEKVDAVQQGLFNDLYALMYVDGKPKKSMTQEEINKAKALVTSFATYEGNKPYITSWSSAIDKYQDKIYDNAKKAIETAEKTKKLEDIKNARVLVNEFLAVTNADMKKVAEELDAQLVKIEAPQAVKDVEDIKVNDLKLTDKKDVQAKIDTAKKLIERVKDEKAKKELNDKLVKSQKAINEKFSQLEAQAGKFVVESVNAINAKQIEVKFSRAMDRSTVENISNYKFEALNTADTTARTIKDVYLQDEKTAVITLDNAMTNGYEYGVTSYKDLKDVAGNYLSERHEAKIKVNDSTRPIVKEIKTLTTNMLQVTFSEPVTVEDTNNNIELVTIDKDGKELHDVLNPIVRGRNITGVSNNERTYVIELQNNLKQGSNYNLYIGGGNGITDYAGLKLAPEKRTLNFAADTSIPKVDNFTLLDQETAIIRFNKPMDINKNDLSVYYNVDGVQGNVVEQIQSSNIKVIDAQTVRVKFNNLIAAGKKYFFVDKVKDFAGNVAQIGKFDINVEEYKKAEVTSVKLQNKQQIEVVFNQEIDDKNSFMPENDGLDHKNIVRKNFVLKDKDGKTLEVKNVQFGETNGKLDSSKRVIELYEDLPQGNNKLTIANIMDRLGRNIASKDFNISYTNTTTLEGEIKAGILENDVEKSAVVVSLDESKSAMPTDASILSAKNWTVETPFGERNFAEVSGAKVKKVNGTTDLFILEADKNAFDTTGKFVVAGLLTSTGSTIAPREFKGVAVKDFATLEDGSKLIDSIEYENNVIKIKLNTVISAFNAGDFVVKGNKEVNDKIENILATDYTVSYANDTSKDNYNSTITIRLNNNVKVKEGTDLKVETKSKVSTTDIFGRKVKSEAILSIKDTAKAKATRAYIVNSVDKDGKDGKKEAEIKVDFNKEITGEISGNDFVVKTASGKDVKVVKARKDNKSIILTVDTDQNLLDKEEVSISFTKKFSTANLADETYKTNSLRLTNVAFTAGAKAETFGGDEAIVFTFSQRLNPDLKINPIESVITDGGKKIKTLFGTIENTKPMFKKDGSVATTYKVDGNTVVATLTGLNGDYAIDEVPDTPATLGSDFKLINQNLETIEGNAVLGNFDIDTFNNFHKIAPSDLLKYGDKEMVSKSSERVENIADLAEEPTVQNVKTAIEAKINNPEIKVEVVKKNGKFEVTLIKGSEKVTKEITATKKIDH